MNEYLSVSFVYEIPKVNKFMFQKYFLGFSYKKCNELVQNIIQLYIVFKQMT
jgi:hypothetical protein